MKSSLFASLLFLFASLVSAQGAPDATLIEEGRTIFREVGDIGCAACHGTYALGDLQIGPSIRGVDEVRIEGALEGAEEMEFLLPLLTDNDITALAAYLGYLGTFEPAPVTFRRGTFEPAELTVSSGSQVQLIVNNLNRSECTFAIDGVELEPLVIPGRKAVDIIWETPTETVSLTAGCQEEGSEHLSIRVEPPAQ
jgi:cytochrome c553